MKVPMKTVKRVATTKSWAKKDLVTQRGVARACYNGENPHITDTLEILEIRWHKVTSRTVLVLQAR